MHGLSHLSGIKLLGDADPTLPLPPLKLELSRYSKSAAQTIINAGGEVKAVYHNNLSLRKEWYPEKFMDKEIKDAKPTRKTISVSFSSCLASIFRSLMLYGYKCITLTPLSMVTSPRKSRLLFER